MPKYAYRCKECDHFFEEVHGMLIKLKDCNECSAIGSLFRVPSIAYSTTGKKASKNKTGELVKEFISDAKKEVYEQKRDMMGDYNK